LLLRWIGRFARDLFFQRIGATCFALGAIKLAD
jgi:hypothetical protein